MQEHKQGLAQTQAFGTDENDLARTQARVCPGRTGLYYTQVRTQNAHARSAHVLLRVTWAGIECLTVSWS